MDARTLTHPRLPRLDRPRNEGVGGSSPPVGSGVSGRSLLIGQPGTPAWQGGDRQGLAEFGRDRLNAMDFGTFHMDTIILHEVPRRTAAGDGAALPVLSEVPSNLTSICATSSRSAGAAASSGTPSMWSVMRPSRRPCRRQSSTSSRPTPTSCPRASRWPSISSHRRRGSIRRGSSSYAAGSSMATAARP